jgi:hypothetical protein
MGPGRILRMTKTTFLDAIQNGDAPLLADGAMGTAQ